MDQTVEKNFLDEVIVKRIRIKIFLTNGFQMTVIIERHDDTAIFCKEGEKRRLVYKHAISTYEL